MAGIVGSSLSEVSTGNYEVKIHNYSQHKNAVVGTEINSPTFTLLGRQWSLLFYVGDKTEESKDYISVYLCNDQRDSEVTASSVVFVLVDQLNIIGSSTIRCAAGEGTFAKRGPSEIRGQGWGFVKFAKKNQLYETDSPFIVNDTAIFRVEISIANNINKLNRRTSAVKQLGAKDILENLFASGLGSDVTFVAFGDTIPAHKNILMAISPVFKAMFTHNMSESNTNEIVISDFSPEVVREMLHFMYTDKLKSETLDNTVYEGLLGAAIKYDVQALEADCIDHFVGQIADDTVLKISIVAEKCGCDELRAACLSHIKMNAASLMNMESFVKFMEQALSSYSTSSDCCEATADALQR